jgi:hypothetical protein
MGEHLIDGEFQSDKYPTCPRGKVPLSTKDPLAQDLLWIYADRRRPVDPEFADDVQTALRAKGYVPPAERPRRAFVLGLRIEADTMFMLQGRLQDVAQDINRLNEQSITDRDDLYTAIGGGSMAGSVLRIARDASRTHDRYFRELDAYLQKVDIAKGEPR